MALDANKFAQVLHDALSVTVDGNGNPSPISRQTLDKARGVIAALQAGSVANAAGTITGTVAPGAPLANGAGSGGVITIQSVPMKAITSQAIPPEAASNIAQENDALIAYIKTGTVSFSAGSITGTCTNTADSPGPLTLGAGSGGRIVGLTGVACAAAVAAARGTSGHDSEQHYAALINYILDNAEVSYASGSITGTCPSGSGSLSAGTGSGGTIS